MTGTCRNSPAEIRFILELSRRGLKRAEIAAQCDLKFKHTTRTANSIGYVIGKWKNDPDFAAPVATAPIQPSQVWTDAAKAYNLTKAIAPNTSQPVTGSQQRQQLYNRPAQQGDPPLYHGQQSYTQQPTTGSSIEYEIQGGQFNSGLGGIANRSYLTTPRQTTPLNARPSYPLPGQQKYHQYPPMNNLAQIPGTYPPSAHPHPVQQAVANGASPLNSEEERRSRIVHAEAVRKYRAIQAAAQPDAPQQPLDQTIDPRMQISSSPTNNQFQGSNPIQQTSGLRIIPQSQSPTYLSPISGQVGTPQNHSLQSSPQQVQTSGAIYPTGRTHTPPQYPPQTGSAQDQTLGYIRPPPDNLHAMTNQRVQHPAADPLFQNRPYRAYTQLQPPSPGAMGPPASTYMNYQQGQIYGPRPSPVNTFTNHSPQMGLPPHQIENGGRVSLSPNPFPHLNQPYQAETVSSPNDHDATSNHTYPSNHGVGIKDEPDMILCQPSRSGRDVLQMFRGMVFNKPFDQSGWSVIFPGNPRVPPPGSRVVKLWEPQFLGIPMFKGQYANRAEVAAGFPAVAVEDDMDPNLAFESCRSNQVPQAPVSSPSSANVSQVAPTPSSQLAVVYPSPSVKDPKSLLDLPGLKRCKVKASPQVNKSSPDSQSAPTQNTGPRDPSPAGSPSNGYIHTPQTQASQLHHQLQHTSTNVGSSVPSEPAAGPFVPGTWCGMAARKTSTIKLGSLTLPKKPGPNSVPPPPPQPPLNLEHYRNNHIPQEGFKSKASTAPKAKGKGRKKNAEPVREKTPEKWVMNAAKTQAYNLYEKKASLKYMPNYVASSDIAASNKRKADELSEVKEREESAKKLKLSADKEETEKQQPSLSDSADSSVPSSTSPIPSVTSLSASAAPSPALSESPAPPPQLLESQIRKRKYERGPEYDNQARAEIAKRLKENHERAAREEREQEQHRKYTARLMAEQAAKKPSQEQSRTASPTETTSKKRKSDDIDDLFEDPQEREKRLKGSDGYQMTEQEEADFNLDRISSQADEYDARPKAGIAPSAERPGQHKELFTAISSDPTLSSLETARQEAAAEDNIIEGLGEEDTSMGTIKSALAEKKSNKIYYVNELKEQTEYERAERQKEWGQTFEESVRDVHAVEAAEYVAPKKKTTEELDKEWLKSLEGMSEEMRNFELVMGRPMYELLPGFEDYEG